MLEVALLARAPRRQRDLVAVSAGVDDVRDRLAVAAADVLQAPPPALVLGGVVQQRRDRLALRSAVLEDEAGDAQQMRDVGPATPGLPA